MSDVKTCGICGTTFTRDGQKAALWVRRTFCASKECRRLGKVRATRERRTGKLEPRPRAVDTQKVIEHRRAVETYLSRARESAQKQRQRREPIKLGAYP